MRKRHNLKIINKKIILLFVTLLLCTGCAILPSKPTAPPAETNLDQATQINLSRLDLQLIKRVDVNSINSFTVHGKAKVLYYRYLDKPVIIKIAKFDSPEAAEDFWLKWLVSLNQEQIKIIEEDENSNEDRLMYFNGKEFIRSWHSSLWYISLIVPGTEDNMNKNIELVDKINNLMEKYFDEL